MKLGGLMTREKISKVRVMNQGPVAFSLFTAWVGALVYFVQRGHGFWGFILAVLKSFVWPAYVLHAVLKLLHV